MHAAWAAEGAELFKCRRQKPRERGLGHLARGHWKLAMTNRTTAADMAFNRNVIGRVAEDEVCGLAIHEDGEAAPVERIAA